MAKSISRDSLYPATFTAAEVFTKDTELLKKGEYVAIGEYKVKADELVGIGRGALVAQSEAIGRFYAEFYDNASTPAAIKEGKLRIMLVSSQDMPIGSKPVFIDVDLSALTTGKDIPSDRFCLPFDNTLLSQDRKIQFFIKNTSGADVTISKANSKVLLDVTRALL